MAQTLLGLGVALPVERIERGRGVHECRLAEVGLGGGERWVPGVHAGWQEYEEAPVMWGFFACALAQTGSFTAAA